jgi:Trk K+ transport system NAD-binding subunit
MTHSELIYKYIRQWFHWRENVGRSEARQPKIDVLIIGAHRLGLNIMRALNSKKIMVVDYDPDVIAHLRRSGYDVTYGDIGDEDVIASIIDIHPKVIISTSPDVQDNIGVLQMIRNVQTKRPFIIVRAETEREAKYLYQHGADFVLLPHLMSGLSLGRALRLNDMGELKRWRKNDLKYLSHPA